MKWDGENKNNSSAGRQQGPAHWEASFGGTLKHRRKIAEGVKNGIKNGKNSHEVNHKEWKKNESCMDLTSGGFPKQGGIHW